MPPAATTVPPAKPRGRPRKPPEPGLGKGYAEVLEDKPAEPVDRDAAGNADPPVPPVNVTDRFRPRRRRPPRWIRIALYVAMLLVAFAVGWMIGQIWGEIDRRVWG